MKKTIKRTLVVTGLIVVALVAFPGVRIFEMLRDARGMTPVETKEIVQGVHSIRDSKVNLYLVKAAGRYVAFDSGTDSGRVRREMGKLNIDPFEVAAVFLTHGDSDHAGGLALFQNAAVYLGSEEEQMVDGRKARLFLFKNRLDRKHKLLIDNETVEAGSVKVTAILTPGHTPGSVCYLVDGRWLFAGDTMSLRAGRADIFSRAINMDNDAKLESLKKLARLTGVQAIFTTHFGYSDSFEDAMKGFRN